MLINNEDIIIYSDGRPTELLAISDMTVGFIKCAI